jgi:hypothetical protein
MAQGWAMWSWATENDTWLQFNGIQRSGKGYVGQEFDRLMKEATGVIESYSPTKKVSILQRLVTGVKDAIGS